MRLQEMGIYVPQAGRPLPQTGPQTSGHHNISWSLWGDRRADPAFGDIETLAKELAAAPFQKAVISAEDLQFLVNKPQLMQKLERTLINAGWQPHYIVFLRDPASYAISLYNEILKIDPSIIFSDYISMILNEGYFQRLDKSGKFFYFDYEIFLSRWKEAAEGKVDIYSFSAAGNGTCVVETFLKAIGITDVQAIMRQARTPRYMWEQMVTRIKAGNSACAARLNQGTKPVTKDMHQHASRVEAAFRPGFERLTAHCKI